MPTRDQVIEKLRAVIDPELRRSIVELEMVRSIDIADDGAVDVPVALTAPGCPIRSHFQQGVTQGVSELEGVRAVNVAFDVLTPDEKQGLQQKLRRNRLPEGALAQVKNVICAGRGSRQWSARRRGRAAAASPRSRRTSRPRSRSKVSARPRSTPTCGDTAS